MAMKFDVTYETRYLRDNKVHFVAFDNQADAEEFAAVVDGDDVFVVKVRHGREKYNSVEVLS